MFLLGIVMFFATDDDDDDDDDADDAGDDVCVFVRLRVIFLMHSYIHRISVLSEFMFRFFLYLLSLRV